MSVVTYEGIVEGGQIRLSPDARLPEQTKVYVIVPGVAAKTMPAIVSPRLADPIQAADFVMEVRKDAGDAGV